MHNSDFKIKIRKGSGLNANQLGIQKPVTAEEKMQAKTLDKLDKARGSMIQVDFFVLGFVLKNNF